MSTYNCGSSDHSRNGSCWCHGCRKCDHNPACGNGWIGSFRYCVAEDHNCLEETQREIRFFWGDPITVRE